MCHDIEDLTFDATAVATTKAQVRPIHWPLRELRRPEPALRLTVNIDDDNPEVTGLAPLAVIEVTRPFTGNRPIDLDDEGAADYACCCPTSTSPPSPNRRWSASPTRFRLQRCSC